MGFSDILFDTYLALLKHCKDYSDIFEGIVRDDSDCAYPKLEVIKMLAQIKYLQKRGDSLDNFNTSEKWFDALHEAKKDFEEVMEKRKKKRDKKNKDHSSSSSE
jgi:hypothetical protein